MTKSKKKNKKKKFNLIDWLDKYVFRTVNLIALIVATTIFLAIKSIVVNVILYKKGVSTYAEVVAIKRVDPHSFFVDYCRTYSFYVSENGQYYIGKTHYNKGYVGDSIEVLYNPKHPEMSDAKEHVLPFLSKE